MDKNGRKRRYQGKLEAAAKSPNGHDSAKIAKRALSHMGKLRERINAADPALVRAAIKELVADISLFWEPDGERYRRLSKGVISVRYASGFVLDSSSRISHKTPPPTRFVFGWRDLPYKPKGDEKAAEAVVALYHGAPVRASEVARHIGTDPATGNATRLLLRAESKGMVQRVARSLWIPWCTKGTALSEKKAVGRL